MIGEVSRRVGLATLAGLALVSAAQAGPVSEYYLTAGDNGTNWVVQGAAVVNTWAQAHPEEQGEYAIAVNSDIRTLGNGNQGFGGEPHVGSQYTLAGVFTGTTYPYPVPDAAFYDGTTDGTSNYSVDFANGGVWRFDADWANGTLLFAAAVNDLGITYDPTDGTLYVASFSTDTITHYSLAGEVLGSFSTGLAAMSCLALDHADGTLWFGSQVTPGTFYQFSKDGAALSTETYTVLAGHNTLGGEFALLAPQAVPEPASAAMMGLGLVGLLGMRARRHLRRRS